MTHSLRIEGITSGFRRPTRRVLRPEHAFVALMSLGVLMPRLAAAEEPVTQIEVVRGGEKSYVTPGDAADPRIQEQNGVQKVYGVEPGTGRIGIETDRFTMEASERTEVRRDIRELIRIYDEVLGVRVRREFRVELELLGDRGEYQRRYRGDQKTLGFYRPSTGETVVSAHDNRRQTRGTMLHETSHAVVDDQLGRIRSWLNEGLAEYFELLARSDGRIQVAVPGQRKLRVLARQQSRARLGLRRMLAESNSDWQKRSGADLNAAYDQAWSLVTFLMDDAARVEVLRSLLRDARGGADTSASLARHYPGGLDALEAQWQAWLRTGGVSHRFD